MLGAPAKAGEEASMPVCRECEDEVDELVRVKVAGKARKVCEDCADRIREEAEIAEESESVVQGMMGFKGRR
jgi:ribosome-binding protein aMBF1 (putative translation factor)